MTGGPPQPLEYGKKPRPKPWGIRSWLLFTYLVIGIGGVLLDFYFGPPRRHPVPATQPIKVPSPMTPSASGS